MNEKSCGIILAAGQGSRMNSDIAKQYLMIADKPVIYYSLLAMENSFIDEIILVTTADSMEYCKKEIVEQYGFKKVTKIITGGTERYHSVYEGIKAAGACNYIFIHDGARPFLSEDILNRLLQDVKKYGACAAAMPAKDTIKIADDNGFVKETPNRQLVWQMQTPQVFQKELIEMAYTRMIESEDEWTREGLVITDDAMVVEYFAQHSIKLSEGSYRNIKITTPEDLKIAEIFSEIKG